LITWRAYFTATLEDGWGSRESLWTALARQDKGTRERDLDGFAGLLISSFPPGYPAEGSRRLDLRADAAVFRSPLRANDVEGGLGYVGLSHQRQCSLYGVAGGARGAFPSRCGLGPGARTMSLQINADPMALLAPNNSLERRSRPSHLSHRNVAG